MTLPVVRPGGDVACPRCGGGFHCGVADPGPCACSALTLPPAVLAELRQRYRGCLCLRCLAEVAAGADPGAGVSAAPAAGAG